MRMSGWTDTPLSEEGVHEAVLLANALRSEPPFAAIYASPLERARSTAEIISAAVCVPVLLDEGLREIFCGEVDGRSVEHVRTAHPEAWNRNWEERDEGFRWPGGESYFEFRSRCVRTLQAIAGRHTGERVLVVTHAGVITQALGWILGVSCARWSTYRPANASITRVEWDRHVRRVLTFDERAHLTALSIPFATSPPRAG